VPYEPKISREANEWMLLVQVVAHVEAADGCDAPTALRQILAALQDEEIPIKWAANLPRSGHQPLLWDLLFDLDDPPTGRLYWSTVTVLPLADYAVLDSPIQVYDEEGELPPTNPSRGLRHLLLRKEPVLRLWPNTEGNGSSAENTKSVSHASKDAIRIEAKKIYQNYDPKPNIADAEKLIREALPTARRQSIRSVLSEPQFASLRRPAGNSKPKG